MTELTNHLSPATQSFIEQLTVDLAIAGFDESKHLREREKQYCDIKRMSGGFYVIRETEEGWWRESIEFKGDVTKQMEKLKADPTVACGWINHARFNEPGGWYDPS